MSDVEISEEFSSKASLLDGPSTDDDTSEKVFYLKQSNNRVEYEKQEIIKTKRLMQSPQTGTSPSIRQQYRFSDESEYRMNHPSRGTCVIINNKKFHQSLDMPTRHGTDRDACSLEQSFHKLGFNVRLEHNKSATDIKELLLRYAKADHSQSDCFACVLLSHGDEGLIYGTDQSIEIEHLITPFKFNRTLAGKPKLFFIQACRGTKLMEGIDANPFKIQYVNKIPMEADFLIAYSTISGYYSWRNSQNGSWFIQALCEVLNTNVNSNKDFIQMLTAVNRKVAYHFESNASDPSMSNKKQIPSIVSMLTKELYFRPKN